MSIFFLLFVFFSSGAQAACNCISGFEEGGYCYAKSLDVDFTEFDYNIKISWNFNSEGEPAYCGEFSNGDYWIAPVNGKNVTIAGLSSSGSGSVSADNMPIPEKLGLLSGVNRYGNYSKDENLINFFPKSFDGVQSIVAAVQRDENMHGDCGTKQVVGECVDAYNILTILSQPVDGRDLLRPSVLDASHKINKLEDFKLELLYSHSISRKSITDVSREHIRQTWLGCSEIFSMRKKGSVTEGFGRESSEGGRAFRSHLLCGDYAAAVSKKWNDHLSQILLSDLSLEESKSAIASMLTYAQDIFYAVFECYGKKGLSDHCDIVRALGGGAGQSMGKYPPLVLYAALSKNEKYSVALRRINKFIGHAHNIAPQEIEQVNGAEAVWGDLHDELSQFDHGRYWAGLFNSQCYDGAKGKCNPNVGKKTIRDPYGMIDGPAEMPGSSYMKVTLGPMRSFVASMYLIPDMCSIMNYRSLIDYIARVSYRGVKTSPDPCAAPDPREDLKLCDPYRRKGCKYYTFSNDGQVTWGPLSEDLSSCVKSTVTGLGRFSRLNGKPVDALFKSPRFESMYFLIDGNKICSSLAVSKE